MVTVAGHMLKADILPHRRVTAFSEPGLAARPSARSTHVWFMLHSYNRWVSCYPADRSTLRKTSSGVGQT